MKTIALPKPLQEPVRNALDAALDQTTIHDLRPATTGGVSTTCRLSTEQASYFLKWNESPQFGLFRAEAQDLALIRDTHSVRVPTVFAWADTAEDRPAYMLQEWAEAGTEAQQASRIGAILGTRLAQMHLASSRDPAPGYGQHDHHRREPCPTQWYADWVEYFREIGLRAQLESAEREGWMTTQRRRRYIAVMDNLDRWLGGVPRSPTLLHGDLHLGNILCDGGGEPVLIDPWAFYGDREWEVAFTTVWGYHPPEFYQAYEEVWPLPDGFKERRDLYLLNSHLWFYKDADVNAARIDAILKIYAD